MHCPGQKSSQDLRVTKPSRQVPLHPGLCLAKLPNTRSLKLTKSQAQGLTLCPANWAQHQGQSCSLDVSMQYLQTSNPDLQVTPRNYRVMLLPIPSVRKPSYWLAETQWIPLVQLLTSPVHSAALRKLCNVQLDLAVLLESFRRKPLKTRALAPMVCLSELRKVHAFPSPRRADKAGVRLLTSSLVLGRIKWLSRYYIQRLLPQSRPDEHH